MVALYLCLKIASVFTEKHSFLPKSVCNWGEGEENLVFSSLLFIMMIFASVHGNQR